LFKKDFTVLKSQTAVLLPFLPGCSDTAIHQQYPKITRSSPFIYLLLTCRSKAMQIFDLPNLHQNYSPTEVGVKLSASRYEADPAGRWLKRGVNVA